MFRRSLDRVIDGAMAVSEIAVVLMMFHITTELLIRWIFRHGLEAVPEITAYFYMTASTFFALAYVTRGDGHISAQLFTEFLGPRALEILRGCILICLFLFMLLLAWQQAVEAISMTALGEMHQGASVNVPKWPGRWFLAIGSALMALYALAAGIRKLLGNDLRDAPAGTAVME
ncbi:MAG: TRAP transporter small permease subunit [Xanthobacteraceae bacterium]